jgi:plasmid maintenance system antidote protein VapI
MPTAPHRLEHLMAERGVKPAVLAVACDVDPTTVHRWKKGHTDIPSRHAVTLARELDVTVDELLTPPALEQAA